jgi:predicted RNA methylase
VANHNDIWAELERHRGTSSSLAEDLQRLFVARRGALQSDEPQQLPLHLSGTAPWSNGLLKCDVADIALAYELRSGNDDRRKAQGAFYTPIAVARDLIEFAEFGELPERILDPACGCGAFLVAAAEWLVDRGLSWPDAVSRLHGADIDEAAVAICRGRLTELSDLDAEDLAEKIVAGDSLDGSPRPTGTFDFIIGNPPFGNAIEARTARTSAERNAFAERFPHAATGAYDKAGLFVEGALQRLASGGKLAFILPRAILSAPYASDLRDHIDEGFELEGVRTFESAGHFAAAAVFVSGLVVSQARNRSGVRVRRDGVEETCPNPGPATWAPLLSPFASVLALIPSDWPTLGEFFEVQASAAAGEAYEIREFVSETEPPGGWRLLTTGSIDPFKVRWSQIPTRYLKAKYDRPWVPREAVRERRARLYDQPKIIVAGLSKMLEAVVDHDGNYAGAVATIALTCKADTPSTSLECACTFLNSWLARTQFLALHGAQALGGGSVQVTKGKLAGLRFPPGLLEVEFGSELSTGKHTLEATPAAAAEARAWEAVIFRLAWGAEWIDTADPAR